MFFVLTFIQRVRRHQIYLLLGLAATAILAGGLAFAATQHVSLSERDPLRYGGVNIESERRLLALQHLSARTTASALSALAGQSAFSVERGAHEALGEP